MGHEISQFDISDRQLLAIKPQPKEIIVSDIGEAKVARTIFGRAKVRVIRERDKKLRTWLLITLAATALAAIAWQGWIIFQQIQNAAPLPPLNERIRVSAPVFQPEDASASLTRSKEKTQTEIIIEGLATRREPPPKASPEPVQQTLQEPVPKLHRESVTKSHRESVSQPPISLKAADQMISKPVNARSEPGSPQAMPAAEGRSSARNQMDVQQPAKPATPSQAAPAAVATPPVSQPEAAIPAAPPAVNKEVAPAPASADQ